MASVFAGGALSVRGPLRCSCVCVRLGAWGFNPRRESLQFSFDAGMQKQRRPGGFGLLSDLAHAVGVLVGVDVFPQFSPSTLVNS